MTQPNGMPENPGDPEQTDPEATSADRAEAAAEEASEAQADAIKDETFEAAAEGDVQVSPEMEAEIEESLEGVDADAEASDVEAQLAERTEDLQRLNAEYTNYRRRTERDRQAVIENTKSQVIAAFLPILDDLDLARQHGDLNEGPLKAFDPEIHEAVQDLSSGGEQVVGTVLRRGYRVGDKLVRNAMVIIADPEPSAEQES